MREVDHGIAMQVKAGVGEGADRGEEAMVIGGVPFGVITADQEMAAQEDGAYQLNQQRQHDNVTHQIDQPGQCRTVVVCRNPDALLQSDPVPHQQPEKSAQRHNPDAAYLKEQGQVQDTPIIENLVNGDDGKTSHTNGTGRCKHGVDKGNGGAWVMEERKIQKNTGQENQTDVEKDDDLHRGQTSFLIGRR